MSNKANFKIGKPGARRGWELGVPEPRDRQNSKKRITPYWRVVKDDGRLNPKFAGGVEAQTARLEAEGHRITPGIGKTLPTVVGISECPSRMAAFLGEIAPLLPHRFRAPGLQKQRIRPAHHCAALSIAACQRRSYRPERQGQQRDCPEVL